MRDARHLWLLAPIMLSSLALILVFQGLVPAALGDVKLTEHGGTSKCFICHTMENPGDPVCMRCHYNQFHREYSPYIHSIRVNTTYQSCAVQHCHGGIVTSLNGSVHAGLSCGACHQVLHVSRYEPEAGAWMFLSRVNSSSTGGDVRAYRPSVPVNFSKSVFFFDGSNDTVKLGVSLTALGEGTVHWAWTNISGTASGISSSTRYLTCFNCHFLTTNPAEAGLAKQIQGKTMIAVPDFALKLSPHSITDKTLNQAYIEAKNNNSNNGGGGNDNGLGLFGSAEEYMQGGLGLILGAGILTALAATRRYM